MHRNASQYKSIPLHSKSSWNGRLHRLLGMGGKPTTSGHLLLLDSLVSLTLRTQFSKRTTGKRINAIIKHIHDETQSQKLMTKHVAICSTLDISLQTLHANSTWTSITHLASVQAWFMALRVVQALNCCNHPRRLLRCWLAKTGPETGAIEAVIGHQTSKCYDKPFALLGLLALLRWSRTFPKHAFPGWLNGNHRYFNQVPVKVIQWKFVWLNGGSCRCLSLKDLSTVVYEHLKGLGTLLDCQSKSIEVHHLCLHPHKEVQLRKETLAMFACHMSHI